MRKASNHSWTRRSRSPLERARVDAAWSAESLGLYTQAVLQGAFILAKAKGGPEVARDCVAHLRRYILQLFHRPIDREE